MTGLHPPRALICLHHVAGCFGTVLLGLIVGADPLAAAEIRGRVEGPSGALSDAEVTLLARGVQVAFARTGPAGEFFFPDVAPGAYQLQVVRPPYQPVVQPITVSDAAVPPLLVRLGALSEEVTVTASRLPVALASAATDVRIVSESDLRSSPYQALDDRLRALPEFSLFRRSSSLTSHPTTQGVSLRGIGPSGVSRSLVLLDGVPLNDAFGGWVYWDRVPLLGVQQVEVANGGPSSLYGNYGLGGVVQLLGRGATPGTLELQAQGGSQASRSAAAFGSHRVGNWGFSTSGSFFHFDGYHVVSKEQRGAVDVPAYSRHQAMRFHADWAPSQRPVVWAMNGGFLRENRGNGTPLTPNRTRSFDASTSLEWSPTSTDQVQVRTFFRRTIFGGNFSAVAAGRNSERITVQQHVPSADGGLAVQWIGTRGRSRLAAGADLWAVRGDSKDNVFNAQQVFFLTRLGGGRQVTYGLFGEHQYSLSPDLTVILGARVDFWRNYEGKLGSFAPTAPAQPPPVADSDKAVFNPSAGIVYQFGASSALFASVHRSFRAPTLNELYRGFTVGNVVTNPNTALVPERSTGLQAGGRVQAYRTLHLSASAFWNRLEDPVSNVTQTITATQIIRQRQNLGRARIYGLQTEAVWQPVSAVRLKGAYLWNRAVVAEFSADPQLEGNRLPQVPENRLTIIPEISLPRRVQVTLIGRFVGEQFDDDLNTSVLPRYFHLDANLSQQVTDSVRLFVAMENITDRRILVNRSPVDFTGAPFAIRGGFTVSFRREQ